MNHVFNHQTLPIRTAEGFPQIFCVCVCFYLKSNNFNFRLAALSQEPHEHRVTKTLSPLVRDGEPSALTDWVGYETVPTLDLR